MELENLLTTHLEKFEIYNQEWWSLVNFTYYPVSQKVIAIVLTIKNATVNWIYPIISLGVNLEGIIMYPEDLSLEVSEDSRVIDLRECQDILGKGYVCFSQVYMEGHICLNNKVGKCHYTLTPSKHNHSTVAVIGHNHICVRSQCPQFIVDGYFNVRHDEKSNVCLCNLISLQGCDIDYASKAPEVLEWNVAFDLYSMVTPVDLSPSVSALKRLLEHPDIQTHSMKIQELGEEIRVTVHHVKGEITAIMNQVLKDTKFKHWWETLFTTPTNVRNLLIHPFVIILIIQLVLILIWIILVVWICEKFKRLHE